MENQYGQALNTHARFNAYASSPSIETSERIHNRRQAKLNYLCSHSHTHTGKCPFVACTAFILYNYTQIYMGVCMYVGTLGFVTPSIQVWARTQLRGKQKQQKQAKSRWSIKQQQYIHMCCLKCVSVCVIVLVSRQRSSSSICTQAGKGKWAPFLVCVCVGLCVCVWPVFGLGLGLGF